MGVAYLLFVKGFVYIGKSTPSFIFTSSFLTSSKYPTKVYTNSELFSVNLLGVVSFGEKNSFWENKGVRFSHLS